MPLLPPTSPQKQSDERQNHVPSSLTANYVVETYTYLVPCSDEVDGEHASFRPLHVNVTSATTTIGGPIVVANEYDATGIMIWPATHLLCQYFCSKLMTTEAIIARPSDETDLHSHISLGNTILELGCGCGLVGVTVALLANQHPRRSTDPRLWVSTDMDTRLLQLVGENMKLNQIMLRSDTDVKGETETKFDSENMRIWIRKLKWGYPQHIHQLLQELSEWKQSNRLVGFDSIVAADIVYPATCDQVLRALFSTVDQLLAPQGIFWLSFCSRDGPKTPTQLISAASEAGFEIHAMPSLPKDIISQLPPLLDAKLLILQRSTTARQHNEGIGLDEHCPVFPGLRAAMVRREEAMLQNEIEVWEPPFSGEDHDAELPT